MCEEIEALIATGPNHNRAASPYKDASLRRTIAVIDIEQSQDAVIDQTLLIFYAVGDLK
jgi:hypothetical protein